MVAAMVAVACSSSQSPSTPTAPTPPPVTPTVSVTVTVLDAITGSPIAGVSAAGTDISGGPSNASGTVSVGAVASQADARTINFTATGYVTRSVTMRIPGAAVTVTMIPSSFNLTAFDEMLRVTRLQRWTAAPPLRVQARTLQFTGVNQADGEGLDDVMSDAERAQLEDDLTWALGLLTGNTFQSFAGITRETVAVGGRMQTLNSGVITVARYAGLTAATGFWGYSRWQFRSDGTVIGGTIMLDRDFERSGSAFRRSLRAHELGHALGYTHVTPSGQLSVMNSAARIEPNTFDQQTTRIAFQRPPGNLRPDADPGGASLNRVGGAVWSRGEGAGGQAPAPAVPGPAWDRHTDPQAAGYCAAPLQAIDAHLRTLGTTAMTVVVGGKVLYEYGPQEEVTYLASVRKSILAMMFGKYVANGTIRLDATLAELGIDDVQGLMPVEKTATVRDLLASRSGVYHEAANAACTGCGSTAGDPPGPRGTVKPGSYFLYNNWDFNALGTIFEKATGKDIYVAFEEDFARPLQLQDWRLEAQRRARRPQASQHSAYHFYLSTRDMARLGLLMLRGGRWGATRLLTEEWVEEMVTPVTPVAAMNPESYRQGPFGYGYLWWIWDGPFETGIYRGAYTGIGAIGQFITVLPELDMVVAHKTRANATAVTRPQYLDLIERLAAARCQRSGSSALPSESGRGRLPIHTFR